MAVHHVNKGIAGFSLCLGTAVFLVSVWTFGSIIYREQLLPPKGQHSHTDGNLGSRNVYFRTDPQQPSTSEDVKQNTSRPDVQPQDEEGFQFWAKFEQMPDFFKGMVIGCAWVSFIGALFQISSSLLIIFSSAKKVLNRSKYLVAMHFLAFIILLATFFTPLAYDRINEKFYTMTSFNSKVKHGLQELEMEGFFRFLFSDLHAYYCILIIDCLFLFFIMITLSCILRFYATPKLDFDGRYQ